LLGCLTDGFSRAIWFKKKFESANARFIDADHTPAPQRLSHATVRNGTLNPTAIDSVTYANAILMEPARSASAWPDRYLTFDRYLTMEIDRVAVSYQLLDLSLAARIAAFLLVFSDSSTFGAGALGPRRRHSLSSFV
jgi:hypothetical protein